MKTAIRKYMEEIATEHRNFFQGKVLNIGCGAKETQFNFLNDKIINIDLYRKNPTGSKIPLDAQADALAMPFKKKSFDAVICAGLFTYVKEPKELAGSIAAVLKEKGHLILTAPFMNKHDSGVKDYWRFTPDGVAEMLSEKFEVLKMVPVGGRYFFFLNFLQFHGLPELVIKPLYPIVKWLTKGEKNKEKWTMGFFVVARAKKK